MSAEDRLPLYALLSGALVAVTIDIDNAAEHVMPHTTTVAAQAGAPAAGPWLTSLVMWANCLRWVDDDGTPQAELARRARTSALALNGMQRWRYLDVSPDGVVTPTRRGRRARAVWAKVLEAKERRLPERYGAEPIAALREALTHFNAAHDSGGPDYLPIVGHGLATKPDLDLRAERVPVAAASDPLPFALARALLAYTLAFERAAPLSLPIYADVARVIDADVMPLRELARRAGVSAEGVAMSLTFLEGRGFANVVPAPGAARGRAARLTKRGQAALTACRACTEALDTSTFARHASAVRAALEPLIGDLGADAPLVRGIVTYPENWRAAVQPAITMPHAPMVLHRGGYPDGS